MDFFEALRERAKHKALFSERVVGGPRRRYLRGVDNTIQAFKEMMVGEPREGCVGHHRPGGTTYVVIEGEGKDNRFTISSEEIGATGEEVVVMVFKTK